MSNPSAPSSRRQALAVALGLCGLFIGRAGQAAQPPINTLNTGSLFSTRTNTAINGYDPVAYFTANKPVKGQDNITHEWNGAQWKFSSTANLDLFKADPQRYAPQYGGYCAFGVARGYLVKIDPEQFSVRDNKLYLNFDAGVQAKWLRDVPGYVKRADQKYPLLIAK